MFGCYFIKYFHATKSEKDTLVRESMKQVGLIGLYKSLDTLSK